MATLHKKGELFVVAGTNLVLSETDFVDENGVQPNEIQIPASGAFTRCSWNSLYSVKAEETQTDSTCYFDVQWTKPGEDWVDAHTTNIEAKILGALPSHNISTTLVGNTIGCTCRNVSDLCKASTINPYSYYKPDGNSPYKLGDFRWYCHYQPGGAILTGNPVSGSSTDNPDGTHNPVTIGVIASKNAQTIALLNTSYQYFKLLVYIGGVLKYTQTFDIRNVDYALMTYESSLAGSTKFSFQMSADGTTWVDAPSYQAITGTITFNPPPWSGSVTNWAEDSNGYASATLHITNNSEGASTEFEYRVRIVSQIGTDPVVDDPGSYATAATLSNGQSYSGSIDCGIIAGANSYQVYVYVKPQYGAEYQIGYNRFV